MLSCMGLVFVFHSSSGQTISCTDSLNSIYYSSRTFTSNSGFENLSSIVTRDMGKIFFYDHYEFNTINSVSDTLVIFRTSANGTPVWSKAINITMGTYEFNFSHICEMSNGNIVLTGGIAYTFNNTGPPMASVLCLDKNGNLLWQKVYTNLGIENSDDNPDGEISEGPGGEMVITGIRGGALLITRMDMNGNVLAGYSYAPSGQTLTALPDGICFINNQLYVAGHYVFSGSTYGFYLLKTDYPTGAITKQVFYQLNHSIPFCDSLTFYPQGEYFTLTNQGNFVYSRLILYPSYCVSNSFFVAQADTNLDIIANRIHEFAPISSSFSGDNEYAGLNSNGYCAYFLDPVNSPTIKNYAIIDNNNDIQLQRRLTLKNTGADLTYLNLDGYGLENIPSIGLQNPDSLQLSETSTDFVTNAYCSSEDSAFLTKTPLLATPVNFTWQQPVNNSVTESPVQMNAINFTIDPVITCQQISICDSLTINGRNSFCISDSAFTFTATKNTLCLKRTLWSVDTSFISAFHQSDDTTVTLQFKQPGKCMLYASLPGCAMVDSLLITVQSPPNLTAGPAVELCMRHDTALVASNGFIQYEWQPADAIIGNTHSQRITISPTQTTAFIVTAQTALGCTASDTVTVVVINCLNKLVMPNAFTPDNGAHNHVIKPIVYGSLEKYDFAIYNRWGQLIFQSTNPTEGWDGSLNGVLQYTGTYVWLCTYQFSGEHEKADKGVFILIR
jgi:gliding motility-associated-like protein